MDEGASLALSYRPTMPTAMSRSGPRYGPLKLGKFVKVLVLISPRRQRHGIEYAEVMMCPRVLPRFASVDRRGQQERRAFYGRGKAQQPVREGATARRQQDRVDRTVLFLSNIDTPLQGSKLLGEPSLNVPDKIVYFLNRPAGRE